MRYVRNIAENYGISAKTFDDLEPYKPIAMGLKKNGLFSLALQEAHKEIEENYH
ncbi:MAG: hypothetical protein HRT47_09165 [Candidatus Caenarcaniphilales bacterium]|nr:hypothetical protein [Candidatus Caenarcaniphilales bacterium]